MLDLERTVRRTVNSVRMQARRATARTRVLPDFVIGGAIKSGTTSLYAQVSQHPSVLLARTKEIHYYQRRFGSGLSWYRANFPLGARMRVIARRTGAAVTGEATPLYLYHPRAPRRVSSDLPGVRLIFVLRDPAERALSHYRHLRRNGFGAPTFDAAVAECLSMEDVEDRSVDRLEGNVPTSVVSPADLLLYYGEYDRFLVNWLREFSMDEILVVFAEENLREPQATTDSVFSHIGLESVSVAAERRMAGSGDLGMSPATYDQLQSYFAEATGRLETLLGRPVPW